MEILGIIVALLVVVAGALVLWMVFGGKRTTSMPGPPILARGRRYRDGAVTYQQLDGMRVLLRMENPYQAHPARYARRHRPKRHTPTKPWTQQRHR